MALPNAHANRAIDYLLGAVVIKPWTPSVFVFVLYCLGLFYFIRWINSRDDENVRPDELVIYNPLSKHTKLPSEPFILLGFDRNITGFGSIVEWSILYNLEMIDQYLLELLTEWGIEARYSDKLRNIEEQLEGFKILGVKLTSGLNIGEECVNSLIDMQNIIYDIIKYQKEKKLEINDRLIAKMHHTMEQALIFSSSLVADRTLLDRHRIDEIIAQEKDWRSAIITERNKLAEMIKEQQYLNVKKGNNMDNFFFRVSQVIELLNRAYHKEPNCAS
jgi:hypothetical protein